MLSQEARFIKILESFGWSKVRWGSQFEADMIEEQHAVDISAPIYPWNMRIGVVAATLGGDGDR